GVWTEQQWGAAGGKGTVTDDGGRKALRLEKQPGKRSLLFPRRALCTLMRAGLIKITQTMVSS
uniref:hypothetical protein n=1 Tax=Escherichia coli TaxID=562 RepID=UPI0021C7394F